MKAFLFYAKLLCKAERNFTMEWIGNLSKGKLNTPEGQKWINEAKKYMTEETMRWVGAETPDGTNMAMISTYIDGDFVFDCAYDGKSRGDEIVTRDIDEALDWLMTAVSGKVHMSYGEFKKRVSALIAKAGGGISVCFNVDWERGRYYANCSDGVKIIGNSMSFKVSVRWGSHGNHASVAEL